MLSSWSACSTSSASSSSVRALDGEKPRPGERLTLRANGEGDAECTLDGVRGTAPDAARNGDEPGRPLPRLALAPRALNGDAERGLSLIHI